MIFKAFSYNILTNVKKTSHENVFKIVDRNIVSVCEKIAELAEKHLSKRSMKSISRFKFTCTDNSTTFTGRKTNSSPAIKSNSYEI